MAKCNELIPAWHDSTINEARKVAQRLFDDEEFLIPASAAVLPVSVGTRIFVWRSLVTPVHCSKANCANVSKLALAMYLWGGFVRNGHMPSLCEPSLGATTQPLPTLALTGRRLYC